MTPYFRVIAGCLRGKVRAVNQDNVSVDGELVRHEELREFTLPHTGIDHLVLVADGMGGHAQGELASELTLSCVNELWNRERPHFPAVDAILAANKAVYDRMSDDDRLRGMGSTLVGAHLRSSTMEWFNVGDSRLYHLSNSNLRQLSVDHVPAGDTMPGSVRSHRVTRSIGGAYARTEVMPAVGTSVLSQGDRVLLCSDGLTDAVSDQQISAILAEPSQLERAARELISAAFEAGARDNVSTILLELTQ
jgi:serine/threonine protein phosphatase PrpC